MGFLDMEMGFLFAPRPVPTEDQIFDAWVAFPGGSTLDEFREAYLNVYGAASSGER